jgi:hypothetical protein
MKKRLQPIPWEAQQAQSEWLLEQFDKLQMKTWTRGDGLIGIKHYPPEDTTQVCRTMIEVFDQDTGLGCPTSQSSEPIEWKFEQDYWDVGVRPQYQRKMPQFSELRFPYSSGGDWLQAIRNGDIHAPAFEILTLESWYDLEGNRFRFSTTYKGQRFYCQIYDETVYERGEQWAMQEAVRQLTDAIRRYDNDETERSPV